MKIFKDPSKIKIVQEDTRREIIKLLRGHEMTISQISDILDKDHSTIYRHMKKLEKAGFVEICGEKTDKRFPEMVYHRTDDAFVLTPDSGFIDKEKMDYELRKDSLEMCLDIMEQSGFEGIYCDENIKRLTDFMVDLSEDTVSYLEKNTEDKRLDDYAFHVFEILLLLLKMNEDDDFKQEVDELVSFLKEL